ncbi:MAG: MFS transporter, partial [Gemmatimonadetes bacterium]|nr:MFS transporter [Gemmatimonadota bacterium]
MPYWRLCGFYLCYFAAVGALIPYLALYLRSIAFTPVQIGGIFALLMVSRIIAPNLWSWLADLRGQQMGLVRLAAFAATIAFAGMLVDTRFGWVALVMLLFAFFWDACLPQVEATTLNHLRGRLAQY